MLAIHNYFQLVEEPEATAGLWRQNYRWGCSAAGRLRLLPHHVRSQGSGAAPLQRWQMETVVRHGVRPASETRKESLRDGTSPHAAFWHHIRVQRSNVATNRRHLGLKWDAGEPGNRHPFQLKWQWVVECRHWYRKKANAWPFIPPQFKRCADQIRPTDLPRPAQTRPVAIQTGRRRKCRFDWGDKDWIRKSRCGWRGWGEPLW